jgi:hypothetical protein
LRLQSWSPLQFDQISLTKSWTGQRTALSSICQSDGAADQSPTSQPRVVGVASGELPLAGQPDLRMLMPQRARIHRHLSVLLCAPSRVRDNKIMSELRDFRYCWHPRSSASITLGASQHDDGGDIESGRARLPKKLDHAVMRTNLYSCRYMKKIRSLRAPALAFAET